jgi:septal ring factor EnvC (AmiA/AmiB activator)
MDAPASPETAEATTKIATLGGPAVTIENQIAAKPADVKPARDAIRKRARALRAKRHRRAAQRARLARQATVAQQPANPFAPPQPTITRRTP